MKTSELTGAALDWAVAKAEGHNWRNAAVSAQYAPAGTDCWMPWWPSANWSQGGPIIEREQIAIDYDHDIWNAAKYGLHWYVGGPTPLVAAMRCYVASKLGNDVDIPKELL